MSNKDDPKYASARLDDGGEESKLIIKARTHTGRISWKRMLLGGAILALEGRLDKAIADHLHGQPPQPETQAPLSQPEPKAPSQSEPVSSPLSGMGSKFIS